MNESEQQQVAAAAEIIIRGIAHQVPFGALYVQAAKAIMFWSVLDTQGCSTREIAKRVFEKYGQSITTSKISDINAYLNILKGQGVELTGQRAPSGARTMLWSVPATASKKAPEKIPEAPLYQVIKH
jgi:hypothetical protein